MHSRAATVDDARHGCKPAIRTFGALVFALALPGCAEVLAPTPPVAFADLAVGAYHACALDLEGNAWCWGRGEAGALATGSFGDSHAATRVRFSDAALRFTAIAAAGAQTCAVDEAGTTHCWGTAASVPGGQQLLPAPVEGAPAFVDIATGIDHACGLTAAGAIHCWGEGDRGQLGRGDAQGDVAPAPVGGGHTFASVTAAGSHTCGLSAAGVGLCWGANEYGQLGIGSVTDRTLPTPVRGGPYTAIDAGTVNTCALAGTTPWCWGYAGDGQPGDYSYYEGRPPEPAPVLVGGIVLAFELASLSAGHFVICGVYASPRLQGLCWGNGEFGQIGDGRTGDHSGPHRVTLHPGHQHHTDALRFRFVDPSGARHSCGLSLDGVVFCWGTGDRGELGSGATFTSFPLRVLQTGLAQ